MGGRLAIAAVWAAAAAAFGPGPVLAEIRVVAATNDLGALARAVGGDRITLDVVARPDRDPHAFLVRPSTLRLAARADVYLEVGLDLDLWSDDVVRGSRNRSLRVVRCADAIEPLEVPEGPVDASMGDVHPEGNPHYWLDPLRGVAVARYLARVFAEEDPENAGAYEAAAEGFGERVAQRMEVWDAALRGRAFVEFHRSWTYLADRFGMEIAGRVEPFPGIPPSARHLAELAEVVAAKRVPVVVRDLYHSQAPLSFLERETGVRTAELAASCARPEPRAYFALFDEVVAVLGRPAVSR